MNFSLNGKKRVSLQQAQLQTQALLRQRHMAKTQQMAKMAQVALVVQMNALMSGNLKDECVKDVITYEIGELSNDVIEPQPQMEEPTIETLSNIIAVQEEPLATVDEEEEEPAAAAAAEEEPAAAAAEEEPAAAAAEEEDDANAVET
jgi:hypothetical protein